MYKDIDNAHDSPKKVNHILVEEDKEFEIKSHITNFNSKFDDARDNSEVAIQLGNSNNVRNKNINNDEEYIKKLKSELRQRKKYQPNSCHKLTALLPTFLIGSISIIRK